MRFSGVSPLRLDVTLGRVDYMQSWLNDQPTAPVATVWLSVVPTGRIRTTACHVESEHVSAIIAAMDALRVELERFHIKSRKSAKVIFFRKC